MTRVDDALDGLTRRELEELRGKIEKRLLTCVIDGNDGAVPVRCTTKSPAAVFTLLLCPACIERNRLPESRADDRP